MCLILQFCGMDIKKRKLQLNRIKEVLRDKGIRQKDLAKELSVSERTVSFWCRNERQPHLDNLYQIAELLEIPPADLLGNGEEIIQE